MHLARRCIDVHGWLDGWMVGWLDGRMGGWMDGCRQYVVRMCQCIGLHIGRPMHTCIGIATYVCTYKHVCR